jgi:hypothetical protein
MASQPSPFQLISARLTSPPFPFAEVRARPIASSLMHGSGTEAVGVPLHKDTVPLH